MNDQLSDPYYADATVTVHAGDAGYDGGLFDLLDEEPA